MTGHFKNALIGFKQGMRFKTPYGWREVLAIRDGIAICWLVGGKAQDFLCEYREPTETMLLDLDRPWVGRQYRRNPGGEVCEVGCMTDNAVFIQWGNTNIQYAIPWDHFKRDFVPVPLEQPFKAGEWAVYDGKMVCIEHYITDGIAMVEEIGSALPSFSVPADRLRRPKVVVIGTWGEWSWMPSVWHDTEENIYALGWGSWSVWVSEGRMSKKAAQWWHEDKRRNRG